MRLTKVFNGLIRWGFKEVPMINKVFGSLVYEKEMSNYQNFKYCICDVKDSIIKTESKATV